MDHGWDRETPIFNALLREWRGHHRSVPAIEAGPPAPGALPAAGPPGGRRAGAERAGAGRTGAEPPISALTRLLPPTAPGAGQTGYFRPDGRPVQGGPAGQGGQPGRLGPGGGYPAPPAPAAPQPPGATATPSAPGAPGPATPGSPGSPGSPRDNALHRLLHPPRRP